jgi:hypothetical protein
MMVGSGHCPVYKESASSYASASVLCASNPLQNLAYVYPGGTFALFLRFLPLRGGSDLVRLISLFFPILFSPHLSNATSLCPAAAPCCSEFGYCGTGNQFCLAGCNPFQSHTLDSCRPSPICKPTTYTFNDESRILTNSTLNDGDATKYDWILDGGAVSVADGELSML